MTHLAVQEGLVPACVGQQLPSSYTGSSHFYQPPTQRFDEGLGQQNSTHRQHGSCTEHSKGGTDPNGEHDVPASGVQHGAAGLDGLQQAGEGTQVHPSQWVDQSGLGVDGHGQDGHRDPRVRVRHGDAQLQPLARPQASEPSGGQRLVRVARGGATLPAAGITLPVCGWRMKAVGTATVWPPLSSMWL
ncbi:hypothetical protein EYF80_028027 [Liparis tanakae]|uniref:Uncharacterized protein n=1 Tax=Liparis tanakae TaxID=230148 RepID=A0A4Z2H967_9TELE|nr:hypothetical protein EYF80_028027 [Liparis tanakae]